MLRNLFIVFLFISVQAPAQQLVEIWNKNQLNVALSSRLTLKVAEKIHFLPEYERASVVYGEVFLSDRPKNWVEYGGGFRVTRAQPEKQRWLTENRLMLFSDFSKPIEDFTLIFGNRFEYRNLKALTDQFRYKQTFTIRFPMLATWGLRFYAAEEAFVRMDDAGLHLARFFGGVDAVKLSNFRLSVYYGLQRARLAGDWYSSDIVGMNLQFAI